jgi:hypothetical protein
MRVRPRTPATLVDSGTAGLPGLLHLKIIRRCAGATAREPSDDLFIAVSLRSVVAMRRAEQFRPPGYHGQAPHLACEKGAASSGRRFLAHVAGLLCTRCKLPRQGSNSDPPGTMDKAPVSPVKREEVEKSVGVDLGR